MTDLSVVTDHFPQRLEPFCHIPQARILLPALQSTRLTNRTLLLNSFFAKENTLPEVQSSNFEGRKCETEFIEDWNQDVADVDEVGSGDVIFSERLLHSLLQDGEDWSGHEDFGHRRRGNGDVTEGDVVADDAFESTVASRLETGKDAPQGAESVRAAEVARKLREELPVIGLISKLTTPTGIGQELVSTHPTQTTLCQSYQEFSRGVYDTLDDDVTTACYELQKTHGEPAQLRFVCLILWMARGLFGTMSPKSIVQAAVRLRSTRDVEDEISQFEAAREEEKLKYGYGETVDYTATKLIPSAVDGLVRLILGVDETEAISAETEEKLKGLILHVFPTAAAVEVDDAFRTRAERAYLYV